MDALISEEALRSLTLEQLIKYERVMKTRTETEFLRRRKEAPCVHCLDKALKTCIKCHWTGIDGYVDAHKLSEADIKVEVDKLLTLINPGRKLSQQTNIPTVKNQTDDCAIEY